MANINKVSGLWPVKYLNGADWDGRGNVYYIPTTDTNVISVGDPLKLGGSADTRGIPSAVQATAGATSVGVVVAVGINPEGVYVDPNNLSLVQAPATKLVGYYALVVDDPNVIFEIQEGGAGPVLTAAAVGEIADWVAAAPAAGVKYSGFYLNNAAAAHDTTITRNMKILGLSRRVDNAYGAFAKWWVLLNNHHYRAGVVGI